MAKATMTLEQATAMGLTAEQVKFGQDNGFVAKDSTVARGLASIRQYTPKNGKGQGVYLVCGKFGAQLFLRLNDGPTLTEEGRKLAERTALELAEVVRAGQVIQEAAKEKEAVAV